jgi:hypothetical protein
MGGNFRIEVTKGVVVVTHTGRLEYADTNKAIAAASEAAVKAGTKQVLFDFRQADIANYYSYAVRHAEFAPDFGLDTTYKIAFLGLPEAIDVLSFMETVAKNHGWQARYFFHFEGALVWLAHASDAEAQAATPRPRPR